MIEVDLEGSLHVRQLPLHTRIPMVLDGVVSASLNYLGDIGPFVVNDAMHEKQDPFLLLVPVDFLNARI